MDWPKFDLTMTGPNYLHGAPVFREEPRMHAVAEVYEIDLRLVAGVKQFAESQRFEHLVPQERPVAASALAC